MLDFMRAALAIASCALLSTSLAQSQPNADQIMRKVGEKYAAAKRYELAATINVINRRIPDGAVEREQSISMHIALESPDKVMLEDEITVYSNGKTAWAYDRARNTYTTLKK